MRLQWLLLKKKKARKLEYFHESEDFRVPKSTYYDRLKRQRLQSAPQDLRNDGASTPRSGDSDGLVEKFTAADDSFPSHELGDLVQDGTILADGTNVADGPSACEESATDLPPQMSEDEIVSSSFSKLPTEKIPNLGTSKAGATAMAMSFCVAHGLTWTALGDLAKLVNNIAGMEVLPRSQYMFRKLWVTQKNDLVQYWYRCIQCESVLEEDQNGDCVCEVCDTKVPASDLHAKSHFFITLDTRKQLHTLIESTKGVLAGGLTARNEKCDDVITDITNGTSFSNLQQTEGLTPDDLTLTMNTDGSPVFKSSKTSVWPLQFTLNELPPAARFKHPVLAGLWFGPTHPNMQAFLSRFVAGVTAMKPIVWEHQACVHRSRVFVLCCAVDAPARAAVLNMKMFNGHHGCLRCFSKTDHQEGEHRTMLVGFHSGLL